MRDMQSKYSSPGQVGMNPRPMRALPTQVVIYSTYHVPKKGQVENQHGHELSPEALIGSVFRDAISAKLVLRTSYRHA